MRKQLAVRGTGYIAISIGASVLVLLYLASLYSYLLFHVLAELFSIAVAWGIFMVVWNSRRFHDNGYLVFVGLIKFSPLVLISINKIITCYF